LNIDLFPLVLYSAIVIVLIVALTAVSHLLGQKRKDHATHEVYESGQLSVGSAQLKISVPFYLTAILFIIFDLEAVFLFAWAISIRETGWLGYAEVFIFITILLAGLLYLWRAGALEWRTARQRNDLQHTLGKGGVVNIKSKKEKEAEHAHDHAHHGGH
jgi:NADH-quinone oxidoreductase subunit A